MPKKPPPRPAPALPAAAAAPALQMTAALWARTDGKLREEHRRAFEVWADSLYPKTATALEWRDRFQTYRSSRVR